MTEMFTYQIKPEKQLKAWYNDKVAKGRSGFIDYVDFLSWYQGQEKKCHYCDLTELDSQRLVMTGLLRSNRFPEGGVMSRGRCRGVWLEIDRVEPKGSYSRNNAVLCCYFCNNDKSDVFPGHQYKLFFQNRASFLKGLLREGLDASKTV